MDNGQYVTNRLVTEAEGAAIQRAVRGEDLITGRSDYGQPQQEYPAVPNSMFRPITIERVLNGYIARVGCQKVVFETAERMLSDIARYLKDPAAVEKEYLSKLK